MRRPVTPLWLARPSRVAGLSQPAARMLLAALALFLMALLIPQATGGDTDTGYFASLVDGVRHGGNYYAVAADTLRASGYPLRPFTTVALPTLTVIAAGLPVLALMAMLYALTAAVAAAWHARFRAALAPRAPVWVASILLLLALLPAIRPERLFVPDTWAGLLIALSLGLRRPDRWIEPVCFGLAAALIRDIAVLYMLVMAVFAWGERRRRETLGWVVGLGIAIIAIAAHAHAVAEVVKPLDAPAAPLAPQGIGLVVASLSVAAMPGWTPHLLAALVIGIGLFGWAAWRSETASRALALFGVAALLIATIGGPDTLHWGQLVTPLLLPGLVFAVDGLRDLFGTALDTRRITVRRIVR